MTDARFWLSLLMACLGTAGFSVLFHIRLRYLPFVILGGGLTYALYAVSDHYLTSYFAAAFLASAFSALYSEVCARVGRAPAVVFLLPCAIPIVPGGSLYRTMVQLISQNFSQARADFLETIKIGMGIAGGIVAVSLAFQIAAGIRSYGKKKVQHRREHS